MGRYRPPMTKPSEQPTPTLDRLMAEGLIKFSFKMRDYYGTNAKGEEISFGGVGHEAEIERYLAAHPTPETW